MILLISTPGGTRSPETRLMLVDLSLPSVVEPGILSDILLQLNSDYRRLGRTKASRREYL